MSWLVRIGMVSLLAFGVSALGAAWLVSMPGCVDLGGLLPGLDNGNDNAGGNNQGNANSGTNPNGNANGGGSNTNANSGGGNGTGNGNMNSGGNGGTNGNSNSGGGNGNSNSGGGNGNSNSGGGNGNSNSGGGSGGGSDGGPPTSITHTLIAQTGAQVPGQPQGVTFTEFGNPVIDASGRVAFWALYSGAGAQGFGGLYVFDGTLKRVVDDNPTVTGIVPGRTTADYFGRFQKTSSFDPLTQDLTWAAGDRLLFISPVSGQKASRGIYRWRATDNNFARIADLEQIIALYPNASPGAFVPDFALPGVSDAGTGFFAVDYRYFTPPPGATLISGQAVYTSNGQTVSIIRDVNQSQDNPGDVPGQDADASFLTIGALTTLNGVGDMLFDARYDGLQGSRGLYLYRAGTLYRVVDNRAGASWPGLPAGAQVNPDGSAYVFANGPAGHIAVDTTLSTGGQAREIVLLYSFGSASWSELTGDQGAVATSLLSAVNDDGQALILAGGQPYLASAGGRTRLSAVLPNLLLGVDFTWAGSGGAVNNNGRAVVAYTRSSTRGLVYWTGQELLVVADALAGVPSGISNVFTITDPRRDRPGRSGLLNDREQIAFRAALSGGGQAIYRATAQ